MLNIYRFLEQLWNKGISFINSLRGDLNGALAAFDKASRKLDKFIEQAHADLKALAAARENLQRTIEQKNSEIDRAYQVSHKLDQLIK